MAHVLLVDDHLDGREAVARFLDLRGHQSTAAVDGRDAMSKLLTDRPDLIILDMRMPRMDGIGLLELLRSYRQWTDLPVILLTAEATPDEIRQARDLGVRRIFRKTQYNLEELAAAVDECLAPPPTRRTR
jgi:CheY-like chemotaxis protein